MEEEVGRNTGEQRGGENMRKTNERLTETDNKFANIKVICRYVRCTCCPLTRHNVQQYKLRPASHHSKFAVHAAH